MTIVTFASADRPGSVTEVAVMVTIAGFGLTAGAVYVIATPLADLVVERVPQGPGQDTVQVTPPCPGSLNTVATNVLERLTPTPAVAGAT
jgi:hypothetical protein